MGGHGALICTLKNPGKYKVRLLKYLVTVISFGYYNIRHSQKLKLGYYICIGLSYRRPKGLWVVILNFTVQYMLQNQKHIKCIFYF